MKKQVIVKCDCNCSCISIDKFDDENTYYVTLYKSYNKSPLKRLKEAILYVFGKSLVDTEIILTEEDYNKIRKF